jgi:aminoglycoside/choline kinase family phosphotransferase
MQLLQQLFEQWAGEACTECLALGANGSNRRYYRLCGATRRCIGTIGDDLRENEAFIACTRHFMAKGIAVPQLYAVSDDHRRYLQQDLGDQSLYGLLLDKRRQGRGFDAEMLALYRQALADLAAIQQAGADLDFSVAYPRPAFDRQSILWDLNYFKYFFLKLGHIDFDEQLLEDDFHHLADFLLEADCDYFLYRDFNPRNIMVSEGLYYIDYQGGRRGAAQYDVASLLYSAKSDLPEPLRLELLNHYLAVRGINGDDKRQWMSHFWGYVLVRILQTLGAYGYRGLYERKPYFIESIPLALNNLRALLENHPIPIALLPELNRALLSVVESGKWKVESGKSSPLTPHSSLLTPHSSLTVTVLSFSYKQGLPEDPSGNGGGFIFDCRALPNPGRDAEYKAITGRDRPVIEFLQKEPAVDQFLGHAKALVGQSVEKYLERRFTHLQVAFGCTGGQHRSVYCAEQVARWLSETYPACTVSLRHREQDR